MNPQQTHGKCCYTEDIHCTGILEISTSSSDNKFLKEDARSEGPPVGVLWPVGYCVEYIP